MANYTGPDPNRMLPGEPWTSDLALAAFEDAVAIAEGAAGAPISQGTWHPWDSDVYGGSDGCIYDQSVDGNVTSIETPVLSPDYQYQIVWDRLGRNEVGQSDLLLDLFLDSTGAYTISGYPLGSVGVLSLTIFNSGFVELQPQGESRRFHIFKAAQFEDVSSNMTTASAVDLDEFAKFTRAAATRITRMRLRASVANTIRSGKAFLYRRKWEGI